MSAAEHHSPRARERRGSDPRVVIVANNANTQFGGEAMLPWQYFRLLRDRGVDAHLVTHERNRDNLLAEAPDQSEHLHFTEDRRLSRVVDRLGWRLPRNVKAITTWVLMTAIGALDLRNAARSLCAQADGPAVIHEPVPVSPRQPSLITRVDAPVVVGPLNGGMSYPPGFRAEVSKVERTTRWALRLTSNLANVVFDGKRRAAVVLVANARTRLALPRGVRDSRVHQMVENGVDLATFTERSAAPTGPPRFVYVGRLVDWKRVDLLLRALSEAPEDFCLEVIGDGPLLAELSGLAAGLEVADRVTFHGLLSQEQCADVLKGCDALVLPSVYECGGAVVLEAMAVALPVIAADWGGPADYVVDGVTGILATPDSPARLVEQLRDAMLRLGRDRDLGRGLGKAGRSRVEAEFDWEHKIDRILTVYRAALTP